MLAYGQHLSSMCTTCHRPASTGGIPPIHGLDAEYLVTTLKFYKDGHRTNPAMVSVVATLMLATACPDGR